MGPVVVKGVVLVLAVLAGAACMWMGYRLFMKGVVEPADGSFKGAGWEVKLAKVGPGVFFALFGAAVIGFAVTRNLSSTTPTTTPTTATAAGPKQVVSEAADAPPPSGAIATASAPASSGASYTTTSATEQAVTIQKAKPPPLVVAKPEALRPAQKAFQSFELKQQHVEHGVRPPEAAN